MFTTNHFIWLAICIIIEIGAVAWLYRHRPSLKSVLSFACIGAVLSEVIKTFSVMQIVPSTDGTTMHMYMEVGHLPFHLCSIQIISIFLARFAKESEWKESLLAFMYPTCSAGAFLALMMPTIFSKSIDISQAFTHPLAYQYFLYHTMLIMLGIYIPMSKEVNIKPKHFFSSLGILSLLAFLSIYLNSMFAVPTYVDGELVSVDYTTNFFFTYETPIGIPLTEKWQWFLYLGIIVGVAVVMLFLFYLPYMVNGKKKKH